MGVKFPKIGLKNQVNLFVLVDWEPFRICAVSMSFGFLNWFMGGLLLDLLSIIDSLCLNYLIESVSHV